MAVRTHDSMAARCQDCVTTSSLPKTQNLDVCLMLWTLPPEQWCRTFGKQIRDECWGYRLVAGYCGVVKRVARRSMDGPEGKRQEESGPERDREAGRRLEGRTTLERCPCLAGP